MLEIATCIADQQPPLRGANQRFGLILLFPKPADLLLDSGYVSKQDFAFRRPHTTFTELLIWIISVSVVQAPIAGHYHFQRAPLS
jgi:hypothetical protein